MHSRTIFIASLLALSPTHLLFAQQMSAPEELAGQWEAPDGHGGTIGMNIWINTTVAGSVTDLSRASQVVSSLTAAIYVRQASQEEPSGLNSFSTSYPGGPTWDGEHLRFDLAGDQQLPEIHVALKWHSASRTWTGLLERAAYKNRAITLRRPTSSSINPFVGSWVESRGAWSSCLHIMQRENGVLTAWSDQLQIPGLLKYANGLKAPEEALERYGQPVRIKVLGPDALQVDLNAYSAMCCSHLFEAKLTSDGRSLSGTRLAGPNQAPGRVTWTRVQGSSCRSSEIPGQQHLP